MRVRQEGIEKWLDHERDLFPPKTHVTFMLSGNWHYGFYRGYHALRGRHWVTNKKTGKAGWLLPTDIQIWEA
jgi:hypothetical protein